MRSIKVSSTNAAAVLLLLAAACVPLNATAQIAPATPQPAAQAAPAGPSMPPAPMQPVQPRFVVVLDAAHGGTDSGAHLRPDLQEKDVTLALANRLRSALQARGIAVVTTRTSDATVPALNRAEIANHAQAAACLLLHATATGSGVHLYASSLSPAPAVRLAAVANGAGSVDHPKPEVRIGNRYRARPRANPHHAWPRLRAAHG